jgi:signal transduction histidine kinase
MEPLTAARLLELERLEPGACLAEGELERLFWAYKGLEAELAGERRFFDSTNEALALAYRQLAEKKVELERVQLALEQMNQTLEQRVADGIATLRESERMAAYGQLVASVVHEIRQPLSAIKTVAFLLSSGPAADEDDVRSLTILRNESARLEALMGDLLDFAKPLALQPVAVDLAKLLNEAVEAFRAQAPAARITVEVAAQGVPEARFDRLRIMQVLLNLLHNAHKHAAGATRVTLEVQKHEEGLLIVAENDGAPIAGEVVGRIFEPFFTTGKGTGLGLAITRRIIEAHGGSIAVKPLTSGTRFTLVFPEATAAG